MLGFPKHRGKDEENLTHFFRHYLEIGENMGITVLDIAKLKKAPEEAYTPLEALIIYVK